MPPKDAQATVPGWTPVPATAMPVSTDLMNPPWDPAFGAPNYMPGYPVDYYGAQQKMSEDEVKKALAERQDFRAAPSYIGDWKTGILDCCAAPGGCETCLLGERTSTTRVRAGLPASECRGCSSSCAADVGAGCCCPWALMGQNTDRLPPGHYCANGSCLCKSPAPACAAAACACSGPAVN
jgi:hypothetical protein